MQHARTEFQACGASSASQGCVCEQASFEAQFGTFGDGQLADFLSTLTAEQPLEASIGTCFWSWSTESESPTRRLVWELQNPPEISPKLDRRRTNCTSPCKLPVLNRETGPVHRRGWVYLMLLWESVAGCCLT